MVEKRVKDLMSKSSEEVELKLDGNNCDTLVSFHLHVLVADTLK